MIQTLFERVATDRSGSVAFRDLLVILGATLASVLTLSLLDAPAFLHLVLGVPLLLFVPGYVATCALFPAGSLGALVGDGHEFRNANGVVERLVFSIGLSLAIVPILGRLLIATSGGFSGPRLLAVVAAFTIVVGGIAIGRRRRVSSLASDSTDDMLLSRGDVVGLFRSGPSKVTLVVVVLGALFVAGSVSFAMAGSVDRGSYSELYLLAQNDSGELQATDYPQEYTVNESRSLVVVVENHEDMPRKYTLAAELQRVDDETGDVTERESVGRFQSQVPAGEEFRWTHDVRPTVTGDRLRLTYLLYEGSPPPEPTVENADETVHLWVTVTERSDENESSVIAAPRSN
jgi:uncharacterized membrane protein